MYACGANISIYSKYNTDLVAQWIAYQTSDLRVVGSSPIVVISFADFLILLTSHGT